LTAVARAACALPAMGAWRIDPMTAMRAHDGTSRSREPGRSAIV
jgi:hypothetical protein